MSLRSLGRQFKGQWENRNRSYLPGTTSHPQGALFYDRRHASLQDSPMEKEQKRRLMAGERNPDAPWRTPILQHHFLGHDPKTGRPRKSPEQQRLF